jgi:hypothetical protein
MPFARNSRQTSNRASLLTFCTPLGASAIRNRSSETSRADILGCPKLAIDAFTNIHRRQIDLLEWGYAWQHAFRRRSADSYQLPHPVADQS